MNLALVFALLLALAVGGVAFALFGGDDAATKRLQALTRPNRRASDAGADRAAKKKQIADSLAELDKTLAQPARRSADPHRAGGLVDAQGHVRDDLRRACGRHRRRDVLSRPATPCCRRWWRSSIGFGSAQSRARAHAHAPDQEVHRRDARGARHHHPRRARRPAGQRHLRIIANEAQEPVRVRVPPRRRAAGARHFRARRVARRWRGACRRRRPTSSPSSSRSSRRPAAICQRGGRQSLEDGARPQADARQDRRHVDGSLGFRRDHRRRAVPRHRRALCDGARLHEPVASPPATAASSPSSASAGWRSAAA